jgi:heavy metal sensor kinase
MLKPLSLKFRLSLLISILLLTTIIVICVTAYVELRENLLKNIDRTLYAMSEGILADFDEPESYKSHQAKFRSITGYETDQQFPIQYRIWTEGDKAYLYVSDPNVEFTADMEIEKAPEIGTVTFFNLKSKKQYRAIWMRHSIDGRVANIFVAHSIRYVEHEMAEFLQLLFILGGSMTVGIFLLIRPIVAWGMRPVDQVATNLHQITHRSLVSQPYMDSLKTPAELRPFVEALQKMFVRLDTALQQQRQFITDASHELRTPLCIIKSTLQTIRMKDRDKTEYITAIDDSLQDVERLERLMEQLLYLGRIDENKKLSNISPVSLEVLIEKLTEVFGADALKQGKRIIWENHTSSVIQGDENELTQLFSNILDNSLKYGPPKSDVHITMDSDSKDRVTVCIHDEGGNIPPDALTHLFDRFYRVDSSRSRATGGAGIGLSIAKEIAIWHGGDIEIISNPATGTSVFVHLPKLQS